MPFFLRVSIERLRNEFWVLPTIIVLVITGVFVIALQIPNSLSSDFATRLFLTSYSEAGARLILSSVATSIMTVIGVLFSLTIVVLQQISVQYSPRVIEHFIKSRASQIMLGFYLGTFIYCILLLRQIPGGVGDDHNRLPQAAVSLALGLALACIALLIHHVHHIAHSIQSTRIAASLKDETVEYMRAYAEFLHAHACDTNVELPPNAHDIKCKSSGYLQSVDFERLDRVLKRAQAKVEVLARPGDYLVRGTPVLRLSCSGSVNEKRVHRCFELGVTRNHAQDERYGLRQLVDMALRALSPGINDPSTAMEVLNAIADILICYVQTERGMCVLRLRFGTSFKVHLVNFDEMISLAFNQILVAAKDHYPVIHRMDEILQNLSASGGRREQASCAGLRSAAMLALHSAPGFDLYLKSERHS